jgi:hypothetical protein
LSYIAGIDFSTRAVDVVLLDENTGHASWQRTELNGADAFDRARSLRWKHLIPDNAWEDVLAVGIEDPRGHNAGALYRVQGAVLARLPSFLLVHPLVPSQWRKLVGLPGNASKQAVMLEAHHRLARRVLFGLFGDFAERTPKWPSDACDAYCIALATQKLVEIKDAA